MSKKQTKKTTSKKTQAKTAKARGTAKQRTAAKQARATDAAPAESRLPAPGTVIKKLDRYGAVRCQCSVDEDGTAIRYKGRVFRSLSGAAMAAAHDLGLTNKTQNGFTFWGLTKPARKADPEILNKAWGRFHALATAATQAATDESRPQLRAALQEHGQALETLLGQVTD